MGRLFRIESPGEIGTNRSENMMKAIAPTKLVEGIPVEVLSAELIAEHKLRIRFSDQFEQEVDFMPFLQGSSHPAIRVYLDPERFKGISYRTGRSGLGGLGFVLSHRGSLRRENIALPSLHSRKAVQVDFVLHVVLGFVVVFVLRGLGGGFGVGGEGHLVAVADDF